MAKGDKTAVQIAEAVGTASGGQGDIPADVIQQAMDEATKACFAKGVTDPDAIREAKLAARQAVKDEFAAAQRKAAREAAKAAKD